MRIFVSIISIISGLSLSLLGQGSAEADSLTPIGGGSGLLIGNDHLCTMTTVGYDRDAQLVGFTAAHCGRVGDAVASISDLLSGPVGFIAYANPLLDYAVIALDSDKVLPLSQIGPSKISTIASPPAASGAVCKQGLITDHTCGTTTGTDESDRLWSLMCVIDGDSGAPITEGDHLVAMVNGYLGLPCIGPTQGTSFKAITNDLNYIGGVGANFAPIP
ncbi:MAG: serine protease [Mycobacteriaceae bacterium]